MADQNHCKSCGILLTADDIGLNKKFIDRDAESFLCIQCLAKEFRCSVRYLKECVLQFKKSGCLLFPPYEENGEN